MAEALSDGALAALVKSLAVERFQHSKIRDVTVQRDVGHDGDPIVRIRVTTNRNPTGEAKLLMGLVEDIRERMESDSAFPIVSLMSAADAKRLDAEPV